MSDSSRYRLVLEHGATLVAVGAAAFLGLTLIFASGFFSVAGLDFARFYRIEELSPLFLPTFVSFVVGCIILSAFELGRYLFNEWIRESSQPQPAPEFKPHHLRNVRFLGAVGFAGYLFFLVFMPIRYHYLTLSFLVVVVSAIDDQAHWISLRDKKPVQRFLAPVLIYFAAVSFNLGQSHALVGTENLRDFCARIPLVKGTFNGVILLRSDAGFLGFDADRAAYVQVDGTGRVLELRAYDEYESLWSRTINPSERRKMLLGVACVAGQKI